MYKWLGLYVLYMAQTKLSEKYGRWRVVTTQKRGGFGGGTQSVYHVQNGTDDADRMKIGAGKEKKRIARTLAATMDAAGAIDFDLITPELGPKEYSDNEWEKWAAESNAVPAKVAGAGKAALAGYLKVVHREREGWIASRLDVSEQTVRQYLSDLREGRR